MRNLLTAITISFSLGGLSQSQVSILTTGDDPAFNNLSIRPSLTVDMGFEEGWGGGAGIDARYIPQSLPVQFRGSFHQNLLGSHTGSDVYKPLMGLELGGAFALIDNTKTKPLRIVLKATSSTSGNIETTKVTYTTSNGSVNSRTLVRGGLYMHRSNWTAGGITDEVQLTVNGSVALMDGNSMSTGIYAGIGLQNRKNLQVEVKNWGKRRNSGLFELYADLIIAPSVNLGEWTDTQGLAGNAGDTYDVREESNAVTQNLGARAGILMNVVNASAKRANGMYFKIETGTRPGMEKHGTFFLMYFGLAFNGQ